MDSVDLEVLRKSAQWLESGQRVLLVTVVKTWGSSPRPPGAMLAVREDGSVVGSVSGGCIEDDIVERSRREGVYITRPQAVTYGVSAEDARKFGLPCGGTIQLVLEPLSRQSRIAELLALVEEGRLVGRTPLFPCGARTPPTGSRSTGRFCGRSMGPVIACWSSAPDSFPNISPRSPSAWIIR